VPPARAELPVLPGRRFAQAGSKVVAPAATSVENDCTRGPCGGGIFVGPVFAVGHVTDWGLWIGLAVVVLEVPRPPPICPTIIIEVGTVLVPVPAANERLFVRLIVRPPVAVVGTVITTGDQWVPAFGFNAAQVAVEPVTAVPQL